ncbi:MAG: cupin-like domain-containing protein [Pirellulales bacterium]
MSVAIAPLELKSGVSAPIDAVDTITAEEFRQNYIKRNRPLVMRRMMDAWPAKEKWTFEFFSQLSLDDSIHLEEGNVMQEHTHFRKASFRDYLQNLLNEPAAQNETGRRAYLSLFNIFSAFPQLAADVDFSVLNRYKIKHTVAGWIGPAGTVTGFHIDWGDNILAQVQGRKQIRLVAPAQTPFMYKSRKFDQGTTISEIDVDRLDRDRFPLFAKVTPATFILHPGDMLFIPRGWWHYVRSLDKSISVSNIAWDAKGILLDAVPQRVKQMLHNAGLVNTDCTCHVVRDGRRVRK